MCLMRGAVAWLVKVGNSKGSSACSRVCWPVPAIPGYLVSCIAGAARLAGNCPLALAMRRHCSYGIYSVLHDVGQCVKHVSQVYV